MAINRKILKIGPGQTRRNQNRCAELLALLLKETLCPFLWKVCDASLGVAQGYKTFFLQDRDGQMRLLSKGADSVMLPLISKLDASQADVVHLAANFSMYCRAGKLYSARFFWRALLPLLGYTGKQSALLRPPQSLRRPAAAAAPEGARRPPPARPPPPRCRHHRRRRRRRRRRRLRRRRRSARPLSCACS